MSNIELKDRAPSYSGSSRSRGKAVDHGEQDVGYGPNDAGGAAHITGSAVKQPHLIKVQPLKREEMQPSYAQDLGTGEVVHGAYGSFLQAVGTIFGICGMVPCCPVSNPFRSVEQGSVGLVSRFGQFYKSVDPGLVQVNICTESLKIVDVKIQIIPIGRQSVITRDNVNVEIDSVIYYQINNPYRSAFGITDLRKALVERAQTTLRQVVGARAVQSVVTERDQIAFEIGEIVADVADNWGVAIEGILIKDIIFGADVAASLSSAAQQKRLGESKVIAARAEVEAAKLMRQAADILASPAAMQIRQLEACGFLYLSRPTRGSDIRHFQCKQWRKQPRARLFSFPCSFSPTSALS
ncbi:unnamed protein product [Mycena citricolor]|uniref:Band 7 domain-containing protein n=1 Tax=Mycena citricolor TaxID=2018698 RepID=A0AAD2GUG6_9AGAR|nr:unnamed protein product [Mycena citricolor]